MCNISPTQQQFIDAFTTGDKPLVEILKELKLSPTDLGKWMTNREFRRQIDLAGKAFRLISASEMVRLISEGIATSKRLLSDDKHGPAFALHVLRVLAAQVRDAEKRRIKRPRRKTLIHPSSRSRQAELAAQLTGHLSKERAPHDQPDAGDGCEATPSPKQSAD